MDEYIKTFDELPIWAKILLALPVVDIVWGIYRLFKSIKNQYTLGVVLDSVASAVQGKILWFEDTKTDNKKDGE